MRATDGNSQTLLLRTSTVRWSDSALVVASIVFALAIGVFLVVRRAESVLTAPLPALQLVAAAVGICLWAIVVQRFAGKRRILSWMPLSALLLFAIGCSYPANRFVDWLVWLPAIGLVGWTKWAANRTKHRPTKQSSIPIADIETADQILQQLTRVRTADGKDAIRGTLVVEFAQGERQNTSYVGFCPPFELLPQIEIIVADDSEADVRLSQVLHNGAQIDVRLSEPAEEPTTVAIEFFAVETR